MFNDPSKVLPHPDAAYEQKVPGVIEALHLPDGGIIRLDDSTRAARVSGGRVYFHRARAFLESGGRSVSIRRNLLDVVKVGDAVSADVIANRIPRAATEDNEESVYFPNCGTNLVALAVYPRSADFEFRPKLPEVIFDGALTSTKEVYIARILSFDDPGPTGVESGLAELIKPDACLTYTGKKGSGRSIASDPQGIKYVVFHRSRMLHLDVPLLDADLRYFFSPKSKCMNDFYCRVQPISNPMAVSIATHEITIGWKKSLHPLPPVGFLPTCKTAKYTLSSPGRVSLLFPHIFSFFNVHFMSRNGWDVEMFENIISGRAPKRNHCPIQPLINSFARVSQIYSPSDTDDIQSKCSMTMFEVEAGQGAGRQCNVKAENVTVFGFSLAETDLRRILEQNDPFWTKVVAPDLWKGNLTASEAWIGWPAAKKQPLSSMPQEDRWRILQFLECRGITLSEFVMAVNGDHPIRPDVPYAPPFLREVNLGHVVGTKMEGGVSSGIIKVYTNIILIINNL